MFNDNEGGTDGAAAAADAKPAEPTAAAQGDDAAAAAGDAHPSDPPGA